ncbi:hypothetical protein DSM106972_058750 [Dulcicalothrix desertica PCC 7102]|uniref:Protein kinase domain-containing protein n=1 Tax=Dulcicalothrix desertica PCC 7102 TaxID=232991 RepID=A0A3S1C8M9_9CYAN|nr:serine/threonine-protein kinase [Dulcicalothrix desertica]RUT02397.1 hypothetical protein DSM106972_058750 [Dulcicalothrix desertica PCC 7102]TWH55384.1 serine/threonine protein kinase with TPR repeats [Dulcicalothrix desertica PCC 7102]
MSIQCPTCLTTNTDSAVSCIACGTPLTTNSNSTGYHLPRGTLLKQGQYQIEKLLGEGGFGITYKGVYLPNSAQVAIKELWPEKAVRIGNTITWPSSIPPAQRLHQINKVQLEASYQQKCVHPSIAQVYDWFEENNTAYIVMEFIPGKSLYQILQDEGILEETRVKYYFLQIAEALKVIHANNLLHRDIKPDNILVDNNRAVLIDFGATKEFIAGQTSEVSITLTRGYAPLEQYSCRGKRFPATDFYALCASMYELLTGNLPPAATDIINGCDTLIPPRQLRPNLSPLIEKIVLTGMQHRVEDRFQGADELIDALNNKFVSPSQKRARELVKQGKLAEAVIVYEKHLNSEPNDGEVATELALVQMHLDDTQAENAAFGAIQLKPSDGRAYGVLGLVNCRKSNWSEALINLQKAANLSPQEGWILANLAWALGNSKNWQQADFFINKALQLEPNSTFALGIQAWIAVNQQQWKLGVSTATQAIFKMRQNSSVNSQQLQQWVYPYLIFALDKAVVTQQATDVERRIQEFIAQVPNNNFGFGFRGWKQAMQGLWNDAALNFDSSNKSSQVSSWTLVNKGITQEHLHNFQAAIQSYETCIVKYPSQYFALYRLGTLYGQAGQWQKARYYLEKAVKLQPNYAEAYHNLGWVMINIKDQNGQVENCTEILSVYRKAFQLYTQQGKHSFAQLIKQAFLAVNAGNF